jgi:glutathione peroxidase
MKTLLATLLFSVSAFSASVYDLKLKDIKGAEYDLGKHKGKVTLFVNIASKCGFTGQLDPLQKLHNKYKDKGLVVVGIPSNEFGGQTPESNEGMAKFCRLNYGVKFPLMQKSVITGKKKIALYKTLLSQSSDKDDVGWNFVKFLVDKKGKVVDRYSSMTGPMSSSITEKIEKLLAEK